MYISSLYSDQMTALNVLWNFYKIVEGKHNGKKFINKQIRKKEKNSTDRVNNRKQ